MTRPRLLIIDDDPDVSQLMRAVAEDMGFDAACGDPSVLNDAYRDDLSAIILSLVTPNVDGVEVVRFLAEKRCRASIIIVSAGDPELMRAVEKLTQDRELHFIGSLQKPFVPENLTAMLTKARLAGAGGRSHRRPLEGLNSQLPTEDELLVMFQPKIDLQTLDFTSVEALVRWQHPSKGLLAPGLFIPAAERSGQIDALTDRIFHKTLAQCNQWMKEDLIITTSINVSARSLSDATLPDRLADMLMCYHVKPSQIILEVSETWLSEEPVNCLDSLTRLALKGFRLSIDDFGTGYSSITQLSRIPFTELKIDQSFVKHAPLNSQARRILESSVELGHHLDMNVVAEGVETQDQWSLVRQANCNECQGFFIARPLPAGSTPAWLERWSSMLDQRRRSMQSTQRIESTPLSPVKM